MNPDLYYEKWQKFLTGKWVREKPTEPGWYPVLERAAGEYLKETTAFSTQLLYRGLDGEIREPGSAWGGWWWSVPMPELPRPPVW